MKHKPFMGVMSNPDDDGPIFVQTMSNSDQGKLVDNLGNSDMKSFKTNDSAMDIVNSPSVKKEFNLGSGPSVSTTLACHLQQHTRCTYQVWQNGPARYEERRILGSETSFC